MLRLPCERRGTEGLIEGTGSDRGFHAEILREDRLRPALLAAVREQVRRAGLQRAIIAAMKTQATSADRSSWRNGPRKSDTITAQMSSAHTVQREMAQLMSRARRESTASSDRMSGADSSPALESPASTDRPRELHAFF